MINIADRQARSKAELAIKKFIGCQTTNFEFIDDYPQSVHDVAIKEIYYQALYPLFDDTIEHKLDGKYQINDNTIDIIGRILLFFKSELIYEWPILYGRSRVLWLPLDIMTLSLTQRIRYLYFKTRSDINIWPFFMVSDLKSWQ